MARITSWQLFAGLALFVSGCGQLAAPQNPALAPQAPLTAKGARAAATMAELYPLIKGARWEYTLLQQQDDGPVREKPMSITVTDVSERAGTARATTERRYESFTPPATRVVRTADAVTLSRLSDPEDGPSLTILRGPFAPGSTWEGRVFGGGNTETVAPIGKETVKVPAGTYEAYRVDHRIHYAQGSEDVLSYWYAPGVGVVKMIERSTLFGENGTVHLQVTGELKRYEAPAAKKRA